MWDWTLFHTSALSRIAAEECLWEVKVSNGSTFLCRLNEGGAMVEVDIREWFEHVDKNQSFHPMEFHPDSDVHIRPWLSTI